MTRIGKYELQDLLGKGGMGDVWRARDTELGRIVALKLLQRTDKEDLTRFRREALLVAKVDHPHVAQIYEFNADPPYLAMQFIEGARIDESPADRIAALRDAARGVHHAHQLGILHRDVKPANILVDASGRAFVLDFGLARDVKSDATTVSLSGDILGTPCYMSPEQARGDIRAFDARTDVYGLGATLYSIIAGRAPFNGPSSFEVVFKVLHDDPLPSGGDRDLDLIASKAMEKDPARRYASAAEFADDLDRYLRKEPIVARPPSTLYRLSKRIQKQPVAYALGSLLILAIAGGVAYGWIRTLRHLEAERQGRLRAEEALKANNLAATVDRAVTLLGELDALGYDPRVSWKTIEPKARELLTRVDEGLKDYPRAANLWYYRGKALANLGREDDAEAAFTKAVDLNPADGRFRYERGMIYMSRFQAMLIGRNKKEVRLKRAGANAWLEKAKDDLTRAESSTAAEDGVVAHVWGLYAADRYADAVREASDRIAFGGRTERYYHVRALARMALDHDAGALADLTAALDRRPGLWQARFSRANLHRHEHRLDDALADLDAALAINPIDAVTYTNRGVVHGQRGALDKAMADFDAALALDPALAMAHVDRGHAYAGARKYEEALAAYDAALALDPRYANAHSARGSAFRAMKRYDDALAAFAAALAVEADFESALINRGILYQELQRHDEALADYDAAVAKHPKSSLALFNRAGLQHLLGRDDLALDDYAASLALEPHRAEARFNRGVILKKLGRHDEALNEYGKAIDLNSGYAAAYNNRGNLYLALGRAAEAVADLEAALKNAPPDWPGRDKIEKNLEDAKRLLSTGDF